MILCDVFLVQKSGDICFEYKGSDIIEGFNLEYCERYVKSIKCVLATEKLVYL